jgi:probable F420-dependent oxidoreductase
MHIGLTMFATDYSIAAHDLAKEAEDRGFESLWLPEHTHIPVSRKTPYPAGGDLPKQYWHTLDPFGALCAAAAVTKKIKLGTGICLLIERDTITTAREAATVDHISNGRFIFGVGGGWNVEEMQNHGTAFETRFAKMKEQVAAVRAIWSEDEPEFHGRFVNFDKIWCWPKPVQKPGPKILIGGLSKQGMQRAADYGDGWMPIDVGFGADGLRPWVQQMRERAASKGRDPNAVTVTVYGVAPKPAALDKYRELGVERVLFALKSEPRDEILPRLDKLQTLLAP